MLPPFCFRLRSPWTSSVKISIRCRCREVWRFAGSDCPLWQAAASGDRCQPTQHIRCDLGPPEKAGIGKFRELLAKHGFIAADSRALIFV